MEKIGRQSLVFFRSQLRDLQLNQCHVICYEWVCYDFFSNETTLTLWASKDGFR